MIAPPSWAGDSTTPATPDPARCPGYPPFPSTSKQHEMWGGYLTARAATVGELADADPGQRRCSPATGVGWPGLEASHHPRWSEHVEVWRAAMGVGPDDRRPTGPVQRHKAARIWQRRLDQAVA